jgi:DNA-binding NarL/FixJ family response regulator
VSTRAAVVAAGSIVRDALASGLSREGIHVVCGAPSIAELEAHLDAECPDVTVVVEPEGPPPLHGGRALAVVRGDDALQMVSLVAAGYDGVVADASIDQIATAMRAVTDSGVVLDPRAAALIVSGWRGGSSGSDTGPRLAPREQQILLLLADGKSVKQIAAELGVTPKTVEHQKGSLYRRIGVTTQAEAVARGIALGLVRAP